MAEFDGVRAKMYRDALRDYPDARKSDLLLMRKHFKPQADEIALEVGAGNGIFSGELAGLVKKLYVADPSAEQLAGVADLGRKNIEIIDKAAEDIKLAPQSIDGVWSFGSVHHIFNKTVAFKNLHTILKPEGRLAIADVFVGSNLARHFDAKVAKYCATGHEVAFLSREYAQTLCDMTGFEQPTFTDCNTSWRFSKREDIGDFLYKLHAMTKSTPADCLKGAEEILGIEEKGNEFLLNWPMTIMETGKI